jgi:hypothetical protein
MNTSCTPEEGAHNPSWPNGLCIIITTTMAHYSVVRSLLRCRYKRDNYGLLSPTGAANYTRYVQKPFALHSPGVYCIYEKGRFK